MSNTISYGIDADNFMPEQVELFNLISVLIFIPFGFNFVCAFACMIKIKTNILFKETNKESVVN